MKKTVLITGASRGIGAASALRLAGRNYNMVLLYKSHSKEARKVESISRKKGSETLLIQADVGNYQAMLDAHKEIGNRFGGVDILINNAGISRYGLIQNTPPQEWQEIFNVNVNSVFYNTKLSIPYMIDNKWGRIVNISSVWGQVGASCESAYSASKGAVIAYTKACAKELSYSGITCNVITPGLVDTPMLHQLDEETIASLRKEMPMGRILTADDIAVWVSHLITDEAFTITGQVISPNGGWIIQ